VPNHGALFPRNFKKEYPIAVSGEGCWITTADGKKYLDAALGGWDLFHDNWEHVGGIIAMCEAGYWRVNWRRDSKGSWIRLGGDKRILEPPTPDITTDFPPHSYYLTPRGHTGETCNNVVWLKFNQKLQQLYPEQEKYTAEIEKSIYNDGLAAQVGAKTIRYHAVMQGQKELSKDSDREPKNTCCEGLGTLLYGSLPGQERGNERFASRAGIALVARSRGALRRLLDRAVGDPDTVARLHGSLRRLRRPDATQHIVDLVVEQIAQRGRS